MQFHDELKREIIRGVPQVFTRDSIPTFLSRFEVAGYRPEGVFFSCHGVDDSYVLVTVNFVNRKIPGPDGRLTVVRPFAGGPENLTWLRMAMERKSRDRLRSQGIMRQIFGG